MITDFIWQNADTIKPDEATEVLIQDDKKDYWLGFYNYRLGIYSDSVDCLKLAAKWWTYISPAPDT